MPPTSANSAETLPSGTVGTAPRAEQTRGGPQLPWLRAVEWRGLIARVVAMAGAALFLYAAFVPWVVITYPVDPSAGPGAQAFTYTLSSDQLIPVVPYALGRLTGHLSAVTSLPYRLIGLIWLGVVTGGLLLATLLWMRLGRWGTLAARVALLAWAVVAALGTGAVLVSFAYVLKHPFRGPQSVVPSIIVRPDPHLALVALALILTLGGVVALLMMGRRAEPATASSSMRRLPRAPRAALVLTVGVLIWALGFFAVPWATVNCTGLHFSLNHFVDGACAGLDAGDALVYSPRLGVKAIDSSTTPGSLLTVIYALAAGYGLLVLLVAWRRGLSRAEVLVGGCWLLAVTSMAVLAARGIRPILEQAPALSAASASGQWVVGAGVIFAFVGLTLAWWGWGLLWRAAPHWRAAISPAL